MLLLLYFCYRVTSDLFNVMVQTADGDWLTETKRLTTMKKKVYEYIVDMSSLYYL